jgi:hypothetical protein
MPRIALCLRVEEEEAKGRPVERLCACNGRYRDNAPDSTTYITS